MPNNTPKYRRQLNTEQVIILELLYKFRFVTVATVKEYFIESNPGMDVFRRLSILAAQGLIAKRYLSNYQLLRKPAVYYLLPAGVRQLQALGKVEEVDRHIRSRYRDKGVSERFINECLDILTIYLALREYNDTLKFFTKADLQHKNYSYFPQPLPDAYMRLAKGKHYFLQVYYEYQPFFLAIRALKRYIEYFEGGIWYDTGTEFPILLFVVSDARLQKRLQKFISKNVYDVSVRVVLSDDIEVGGLTP